MQIWTILLAAGQGARLNPISPAKRKQFITWKGLPLFWHSAMTLSKVNPVRGIVFVFPEMDMEEASALVAKLNLEHPLSVPFKTTTGGKERQDSVWNGLTALPPECTEVLVHDAARPFVSAAIAKRIINALEEGCKGVIPGCTPADTIKLVDVSGFVAATPDRSELRSIQTPQGFKREVLHAAHVECHNKGIQVTDDASMLEQCKVEVKIVPGEPENVKITHPTDLKLLEFSEPETAERLHAPCVGMGYDVHGYGGNRPFVLGGVPIATDILVKAHSDGDVLLHALMDALLGCAGAGDIGMLFPDSAEIYYNINSAVLLAEVLELVWSKNILLTHADLTVIAQVPKIAPFNAEIKRNLAHLLHLDEKQVNLKATTEEGLGFTGAKLGIKAMAVVTGLRKL